MNILLGIMNQYDQMFDLKWFYITSWRQFDVWTSYFGFMGHYDMTFDLKINVGLCYLYLMVQ